MVAGTEDMVRVMDRRSGWRREERNMWWSTDGRCAFHLPILLIKYTRRSADARGIPRLAWVTGPARGGVT